MYESDNPKTIPQNCDQEKVIIHDSGWLDDSTADQYKDRDNPMKLNKLTCSIDGYKYKKNSDGKWVVCMRTDNTKPQQNQEDISYTFKKLGIHIDELYAKETRNTKSADIILNNLDARKSKMQVLARNGQTDSGANACVTRYLELLEDVVWIKPLSVGTASNNNKQGGTITMQAVGKLPLQDENGETIKVACYYSPDVDGTLVSLQAIAMEHSNRFFGWIHYCNTDKSTGYIRFINRENQQAFNIGIWCENNLWFHSVGNGKMIKTIKENSNMKICRLNNAASYELWHQRLGHCGHNTLVKMHQYAEGIPQLKGTNAFYKCPSCMRAKMTKQPYHRDKHRKPKSRVEVLTNKDHSQTPIPDDIVMPNALPGQHFHMDFGFVKGVNYSRKDKEGKTVTSIDGKNSYLLIVDRATRFIWVYLSASKQPPLQFIRDILTKFRSHHPHRTVRTDQGELGTSKEFRQMLNEDGLKFNLEITGADNSH